MTSRWSCIPPAKRKFALLFLQDSGQRYETAQYDPLFRCWFLSDGRTAPAYTPWHPLPRHGGVDLSATHELEEKGDNDDE